MSASTATSEPLGPWAEASGPHLKKVWWAKAAADLVAAAPDLSRGADGGRGRMNAEVKPKHWAAFARPAQPAYCGFRSSAFASSAIEAASALTNA